MIFFLFGEDDFRSSERKKEIIASFKNNSEVLDEIITFTKENLSFEEFRKVLQRRPLFSKRQIIVLEDIFSCKEFKEKFLKEKEKILASEDIILIHEKEGKFKKEDPLFLFLKSKAKCEQFFSLSGESLKKWTIERAKKYNLFLKKEVVEKLIEFKGNNLWELDNELKKLSLYQKHKTIDVKDLELLVSFTSEENIFGIIEAILKKDKKRGIFLLNLYWQKGVPPLFLLSIFLTQIKNLLVVREFFEKKEPYFSILKKTNLNPFFFRRLYLCAKNFSLLELKKLREKIFQIELEVKTGKGEALTLLTLLFANLD